MTTIYHYVRNDFVDMGLAGEGLLEITARIEHEDHGPFSHPRMSCSILMATVTLLANRIAQTVIVTEQCQGIYEDEIKDAFKRALEVANSCEGDEAS